MHHNICSQNSLFVGLQEYHVRLARPGRLCSVHLFRLVLYQYVLALRQTIYVNFYSKPLFFAVAVFVFVNLFVAVLLESFEREFDASTELDLSVDDIQRFKDLWDEKCDRLLEDGLEPRIVKRCGLFPRKVVNEIPIRFLEQFIRELPVRRNCMPQP